MPIRGPRYRLTIPTMGIIKIDGQNRPTIVPAGALLKLIDGPFNGNRLVDVKWEDKTVMMFTADIRDRSVRLEEV